MNTATARTTISTLGQLGVSGGDPEGTAALHRQPKRLAVFLYVVLSQRHGPVSRDAVAAVFWPGVNPVRARNALRQAVLFIRRCLGEGAMVSVGPNELLVSPAIFCDATQFELLLDTGQLVDALSLYRGPLLPTLPVQLTSAFDAWVDARREYFAHRAAKAAWDLSSECECNGDTAGAAMWGKRALALSPFSESEVQRVLRLLNRVGDSAGALRAFRGLERMLESKFGARPSAETVELAGALAGRPESAPFADAHAAEARRRADDRRRVERRLVQAEWMGRDRRTRMPDRRSRDRRISIDRRAIR